MVSEPPPIPPSVPSGSASPPPLETPRTSGLAILSLVLGIVGCTTGITSIFAVIFGHVARRQIIRSLGRLGGMGLANAGLICGYLSLIMAFIGILSLASIMFAGKRMEERRKAPFEPERIAVPRFPEALDPGMIIEGTNVRVTQFETQGSGPGGSMQIRVYLPGGYEETADSSLSAVLVAPAGSNGFNGTDIGPLDPDSYHKETLPYAEAGMVVVFYSLDGNREVDESLSDDVGLARFVSNYDAFREAQAGVINGRNALAFVLENLGKVHPERIYTAGHSSAGTLSLLLAMHEPRIAACAAYAPCVDLKAFHEELLEDPDLISFLADIESFLNRASPMTHVDRLNCPLFLFHSKEDRVLPFEKTLAFANALIERSDGPALTFRAIEEGDHYYPMLRQGIPDAIKWFQE